MPLHAQSMEQTVRAAVTTNPAARAADEGVRAAALELLQLEGEYLPRVSLYGEAGAEYYDEAGRLDDPETRFAREVGVQAELVLFDGHARANRVWRNAARLDGAIFRLLDASETLALSAVQAHIDVARHARLLQVSDRNVTRHMAIARQVDELVEGGRQPASAGFEVEERLLAARLARLDVRRALADARARYRAVVGRDPGPAPSVPSVSGLPPSLEALAARAVQASHRVRNADTVIRTRLYDRGIDAAARRPQVSLRAGARYAHDRFGDDGEQGDAFVGLRLDWELHAGGRKARASALAARVRQAEAERQEAVREVQEFAAQAWNAYRAGTERVVLLQVRRRSAERVVTQYREEFRAGTRTLLDVLDAERTLFNVRFEEVSARAALDFAQYRVLAAESRLAARFGVQPSEVALAPGFEPRARSGRPAAIFDTEIRALE